MQQQPAWKSVYSNGPAAHRHKQASRPSSSSDGAGNRPQSKQQHAAHPCPPCTAVTAAHPCSNATPEQQNTSEEALAAEYNHSGSKQQQLISTRATTPGKLKQTAHSNPGAATGATAQQALLTRQHAANQQQQQQQAPADISSRPATAMGTVSATGNTHPASTRRLSSPPGQAVSRPAQQQALSPYLAALPLAARRPRSPGGPRPASPLSGLSRAVRNGGANTPSTILAATTAAGNSSCTQQQQQSCRSRAGLHSASGRKRPHQQQLRHNLAEFYIQVSYGPQPGFVTHGKEAAGTPAASAAQQTAGSQHNSRAAQPAFVGNSRPVAHSSNKAGIEAPLDNAQAAGDSTAAAREPAVPAICQYSAGEDSFDDDTAAAAGDCNDGSSCSEGAEQGLGIMLSEYILQMHTTPVACNSVSGLGDESENEEDYEPAQHTSRHCSHSTPHQYSGQGSILASWGMLGAPSAAAPLQPVFGEDDDSTPSTPASESDRSMAASPTGCIDADPAAATVAATAISAAAAATPAAGSPCAAAEAWQHISRPGTFDNRASRSWQQALSCRQDSAGSTCSSECVLADHKATAAAAATESGFPPSDCECELYRDIMGSDSSSSSLDLEHSAQSLKNPSSSSLAAAIAAVQVQHSSAAIGAQDTSVRSEGVAGNSTRPQSSAGRRGQAGSSSASSTKELQAGRRPSGFLMASANTLDLRPATAMAAVCGGSSISGRYATDAQAALCLNSSGSSGRPLSNCQQQRSFTDLDSSAEGFVKEVSLGHLSASLFTPAAVDANARVPLQRLWGAFEVGSTHSSFSGRDAGALQHQQRRQQDAAEEGWAAAGAEQQQQQQKQQQGSSAQKPLSPTRAAPGAGAGFLQRLTQSTQRRDADNQPSVHATISGGWCSSEDADKLAVHNGPGSCMELRSSFGGQSRNTRDIQQQQQQQSMEMLPEPALASIYSTALDRSLTPAQTVSAIGGPSPIVAWGAPACATNGPAGRPTSRRAPPAGNVTSSRQLESTGPEQLQQPEAWAVHISSSKRTSYAGTDGAKADRGAAVAAANAKVQHANSPLLHSCQHADVGRHGRDAAVASVGQAVQQSLRPPSRQRPPSESLHLFNSLAALT